MKKHLDTTIVFPNTNILEMHTALDRIDGGEEYSKYVDQLEKQFEEFDSLPSPRLMKSHLPAFLLPKQIWTVRPKVIHMCRDVKDVAVSYYHMCCNDTFSPYKGSAQDLFDTFYNDYIVWGPYHEHVQSYLQLHQLDHLLLMTYEEMKAKTFAAVKKVNKFLECTFSDEKLYQLIDQASFEKMQGRLTKMIIYQPEFK